MQKVEKLSGERIRLGPGTLYGALSNLVEAKLIQPVDSVLRSSIIFNIYLPFLIILTIVVVLAVYAIIRILLIIKRLKKDIRQ